MPNKPHPDDEVRISPPLPDGNWELTPRPADSLDEADLKIVEIPKEGAGSE